MIASSSCLVDLPSPQFRSQDVAETRANGFAHSSAIHHARKVRGGRHGARSGAKGRREDAVGNCHLLRVQSTGSIFTGGAVRKELMCDRERAHTLCPSGGSVSLRRAHATSPPLAFSRRDKWAASRHLLDRHCGCLEGEVGVIVKGLEQVGVS